MGFEIIVIIITYLIYYVFNVYILFYFILFNCKYNLIK